MRALADPLRMQIVTLLARETLCTTHLVEETGARQTNLSNHLRVLREAGVVDTAPCASLALRGAPNGLYGGADRHGRHNR
jgi:DNA-binding transcriptional ArsR family regulator